MTQATTKGLARPLGEWKNYLSGQEMGDPSLGREYVSGALEPLEDVQGWTPMHHIWTG